MQVGLFIEYLLQMYVRNRVKGAPISNRGICSLNSGNLLMCDEDVAACGSCHEIRLISI